MPKLFKILIDVEEVAVGHVLSTLKRTEGVVQFDLIMDTKRPEKTNGHAKDAKKDGRKTRFVDPTGARGSDIVLRALVKSKTPLRQPDFTKAFEASGRKASSASSVLHVMSQEGLILNDGMGYRLTKKGRDKARYAKRA